MLRRKLKTTEAKLATSVLPCKTTNHSSQTEIQPSIEAAIVESYLGVKIATLTQDTSVHTDNSAEDAAMIADLQQRLSWTMQYCNTMVVAQVADSMEEQVIAMVAAKTGPIMQRVDALISENAGLRAQVATLQKMIK
jgi:hypothetical protein